MPKHKRKAKVPTPAQQQSYDNLLKSLLEGYEKEILPHLLAEAEYQETLDIEVHHASLRVEHVCRIKYHQHQHILHLEFEGPLNMYNDLMERDPKMQRLFAEREALGEARGKAQGKARGETKAVAKGRAKGLKVSIIDIVEVRFPELVDLARLRVADITETATLRLLLKGVAAASNEDEAKRLLDIVA